MFRNRFCNMILKVSYHKIILFTSNVVAPICLKTKSPLVADHHECHPCGGEGRATDARCGRALAAAISGEAGYLPL